MQVISEATRENANIVTLTITSDNALPFSSWIPGQFIRISVLYGQEWSEEHTFTISSAPEEKLLRMTIKAVGPFTTALQTIKPGTEVRLHGPYGKFCKDIEKTPRIVMIAGGIGITPFLSVLRHFRSIGAKNHVVLFWANNTVADIIRCDELLGLIDTLDMQVVHVLWKEDETALVKYSCHNQFYAAGLLSPDIIRKYSDIVTSEFFLCGPPKMNDFAVNILKNLGVDALKIHTEQQVPPPPKRPA
jgi:ferredoxin-NADP reductase